MEIKPGQINRLVPGLLEQTGTAKPTKSDSLSFGDQLSSMINSVNDLQMQAGAAQKAFLAGEPVELHDVMIKAGEAGLAMDLLLQVRNRLVDGYKELIRMPV